MNNTFESSVKYVHKSHTANSSEHYKYTSEENDPTCGSVTRCLHEAIVAAIGRATDRRDDRTV